MSGFAHRVGVRQRTTILTLAVVIAWAVVAGASPPAWAARGLVANSGSPDTVTLFDTLTGSTITITYSFFVGPRWVAVTEDGRFAGVTNGDGKTVTWIDLRNHQAPVVLGKTFVDSNPTGIAIKGNVAVVAVDDPTAGHADSVKVIAIGGLPGIPRDTEITSVSLDVDANPEGVAITPDGRVALVAQKGLSNVAYVDLTSPTLLAGRTPVGSGPFGVAVTPDNTKALVTNRGAGTLSVIDISALPTVPDASLVTTLSSGNAPRGLAMSPDGGEVVIADAGSADTARIVDLSTFTATTVSLKTPLATDPNPFGVATALSPDGPKAVIANEEANTVSVLDLTTQTVVMTIDVGSGPRGLAIIPNKQPPKARLTARPTEGIAPLLVTLDGSTSTDSGGTIVSYTFTFGDGTSVTTSSPTVTHLYSSTGNFTASLVVTDDDGAPSRTARTSIQAKVNKPPDSELTASPTSGKPPLLVTLDGSGSTDSDGSVASYTFTFGDGTSVTTSGPTVTHLYTSTGNFTASLVVTDNIGASSTPSQTSIQVKPNKPPKAALRANPASGIAPFLATLDGSGSTDSDGTIASYTFTFGDGTSVTTSSPTVTHLYTTPGNFAARLVVTDNLGASSTAAQTSVQVRANKPPSAAFRVDPNSGTAPLTVKFTNQSQDSDGTIVAVRWDFGDGTTAGEQNPTHTYTKAGAFVVTLTVTDDKGGSAQKTGKVQVR